MIEEPELFQHFSATPKPELRPFLAARAAANARGKQSKIVAFIWLAVIIVCVATLVSVRVPNAALPVALLALAPVMMRRNIRTRCAKALRSLVAQ